MGILERLFGEGGQELVNAELLEDMRALAEEDTPPRRAKLYESLRRARLILPMAERESAPPGLQEEVNLLIERDEQGAKLLPAFTDLAALRAWNGACPQQAAIAGESLLELALDHEFAALLINPAGPVGGGLTRAEIQMLLEGLTPLEWSEDGTTVQLGVDGEVAVGAPQGESPGWLAPARAAIEARDEIATAYLFDLHARQGAPRRVVGLELRSPLGEEQRAALIGGLFDEMSPLMPLESFVDFVILDSAELLEAVRRAVPAFAGEAAGAAGG